MVTNLEGRRKDYYEGILQLRDVSPAFIDAIIQQIEDSGKCAIARIKPGPRGVDIFVSDQHYVQSLGKLLKAKHGGSLLVTKKLFGRWGKTGHVVYRVTVLYRKLPYKVGDVIPTEDGEIKILSIKKMVQVQNLTSGRKEQLKPEEIEKLVR